tara:strand:- start:193 stop:372 length:180 start_codon:yes stop_codon:yes gene_type:complete
MVKRYKQLFSELKLLEHQLKNKCKVKYGQEVAFRMLLKKKYFVNPDSFLELLGGKDGEE